MNLRDLRYLVALAEHRHFGRAAEASFVSQPTLSTQIRKLEEELGVALFERAPRKVMLTPVGHDIVERARKVLADVDQIAQIARRSQDPEAGTLRLGLFPTLGPYLLPHVLPGLRKRFPRLELLLVEDKTDALLERLRDGRLDAAILALPLDEQERLHVEVLFDEPFLLATPANHALAARGPLSIQDLDGERLLLLEEGHCLREQALDVCRLAGAGERDFRATSLETLRQMVAAGVGSTLLPALAVQPPVPPSPDIQLVPFRGEPPFRRVALAWRRSSALDGLLKQMAAEIRKLPPGLLQPPS